MTPPSACPTTIRRPGQGPPRRGRRPRRRRGARASGATCSACRWSSSCPIEQRPGHDRVPAGRRVQGRARPADRRHDRRRALPREQGRGLPPRLLRGRRPQRRADAARARRHRAHRPRSPRKGAEGPVAFLHPRSCHGVLVELIEAPGGPAWAARLRGLRRSAAHPPVLAQPKRPGEDHVAGAGRPRARTRRSGRPGRGSRASPRAAGGRAPPRAARSSGRRGRRGASSGTRGDRLDPVGVDPLDDPLPVGRVRRARCGHRGSRPARRAPVTDRTASAEQVEPGGVEAAAERRGGRRSGPGRRRPPGRRPRATRTMSRASPATRSIRLLMGARRRSSFHCAPPPRRLSEV